MKKIVNHIVISGKDSSNISEEVRKYIEDGSWQPVGGIAVISINNTVTFYQAMIQYED